MIITVPKARICQVIIISGQDEETVIYRNALNRDKYV